MYCSSTVAIMFSLEADHLITAAFLFSDGAALCSLHIFKQINRPINEEDHMADKKATKRLRNISGSQAGRASCSHRVDLHADRVVSLTEWFFTCLFISAVSRERLIKRHEEQW